MSTITHIPKKKKATAKQLLADCKLIHFNVYITDQFRPFSAVNRPHCMTAVVQNPPNPGLQLIVLLTRVFIKSSIFEKFMYAQYHTPSVFKTLTTKIFLLVYQLNSTHMTTQVARVIQDHTWGNT